MDVTSQENKQLLSIASRLEKIYQKNMIRRSIVEEDDETLRSIRDAIMALQEIVDYGWSE